MNKPTAGDLTTQLAEARARLQPLIDAQARVMQAAMADLQNGGRASEIEKFKNEQLGLLREPLATAHKEVSDIQGQIDALARAKSTATAKARHADIDASIEADRKELDRCKAEVKRLQDKRADIETQLTAARSLRLKLASDAEDLIHTQGLALSDGGQFDDQKVQSLRAESTHQADRVKAYEVAALSLDSKIKEARENVILADRNLAEMLGIKRYQDDQKLLQKAIKAIGSPGELARIVVDAIASGTLAKPSNSGRVG
jgi:chromosome segregation ATPase